MRNLTRDQVAALPSSDLKGVVRGTNPTGRFAAEVVWAKAELARRGVKREEAPDLLVALASAISYNDLVGPWLSAALDDPNVCREMKADIAAWMDEQAGIRAALAKATSEPAQ